MIVTMVSKTTRQSVILDTTHSAETKKVEVRGDTFLSGVFYSILNEKNLWRGYVVDEMIPFVVSGVIQTWMDEYLITIFLPTYSEHYEYLISNYEQGGE